MIKYPQKNTDATQERPCANPDADRIETHPGRLELRGAQIAAPKVVVIRGAVQWVVPISLSDNPINDRCDSPDGIPSVIQPLVRNRAARPQHVTCSLSVHMDPTHHD